MDLRSLIEKMDAIEQRQLLKESEQLMEKVRIRYSDVEAVANQYKDDEAGRLAALTKLIHDNNLPGLFDPIKKEIVKPDGTYGWFAGANEATVKRLEQWGLLPPEAKTSSWLGTRGEDETTAQAANTKARSRDEMVDRAEKLMKQAVTAATSPVVAKEGIANSLLESFGINVALLESITADEHKELKGLIQQLSSFAATDPDAADIVAQFKAYNQQRDQLIARIKEIITALKGLTPKAASATPGAEAPAASAEVNASNATANTTGGPTNMGAAIRENATLKAPLIETVDSVNKHTFKYLNESQTFLIDGNECRYNPMSETFFYEDANGQIVEYSLKDFGGDVGDFTRGVGQGLTFGTMDNIVAYAKSKINGTPYAAELKKELVASEKSRERSPWLNFAGNVVGGSAFGVTGLARNAALIAADLGFQHFKKGYDAQTVADYEKNKANGSGARPSQPGVAQPGARQPAGAPQAAVNAEGAKLAQSIGIDVSSKEAATASLQQLMKKTGAKDPAEAIAIAVGAQPAGVGESLNDISRLAGLNEAGVKLPPGVSRWLDPLASAAERNFANTLTARIAGQTWERVPGVADKFYNKITGEVKDASDIWKMIQAAEKGGEKVATKTADAAANKAADAVVDATTTAGKKGVVQTAKNASTAVLTRIKSAGGKLAEWAKNHKWLAIVLALAGLGVIIAGLTDGPTPSPSPAPGPHPGPHVQPRPTEDEEKKKERERQLAELNKLLDQLVGGWPTDAETAETLRQAAEVGGKPTAGAQSGSAARPSPDAGNTESEYEKKVRADNALRGKEQVNP